MTFPSGPNVHGRLAWGNELRQMYTVITVAGMVALEESTTAGMTEIKKLVCTSGWAEMM